MPVPQDEFVALLTKAQPALYGYIGRLVANRTDADDVLQETNAAIWKMADQFIEGTNFVAWACRVAYFRVLENRTAGKKFRVRLADKALEMISTVSLAENSLDSLVEAEQFEARRRILSDCLDEISERNRRLLLDYYERGRSLGDIAIKIGRSANAVAQLFHRIRASIRACVKRKLMGTASPYRP